MHPLSLSARCMVLDLVEEDDDDGDEEEDTRYSDAKYVKNNELAISDIICMYVCMLKSFGCLVRPAVGRMIGGFRSKYVQNSR